MTRPIGRARTRPDRLRGDKAYSSRAIRTHLRQRAIVAVIPEPADQAGHRKRRGSRGGRPPAFDPADYRNRNVIERRFCHLKQWRGLDGMQVRRLGAGTSRKLSWVAGEGYAWGR